MLKLGEALGAIEPAHIRPAAERDSHGRDCASAGRRCARSCSPDEPGCGSRRLGLFVSCPVVLKTGAMFHPAAARRVPRHARAGARRPDARATPLRPRRSARARARRRGRPARPLRRASGRSASSASRCSRRRSPGRRSVAQRCARSSSSASWGCSSPLPWYVYLQTRYSNPIFGRTSAPSSAVVTRRSRSRPLRRAGAVPARRGATLPSQTAPVLRRPRPAGGVTAPHRAELAPGVLADPLHRHVGRLLRDLEVGLDPEADDALDREPAHRADDRRGAADVPRRRPVCSRSRRSPSHACARRPELVLVPADAARRARGNALLRRSYPTVDGGHGEGALPPSRRAGLCGLLRVCGRDDRPPLALARRSLSRCPSPSASSSRLPSGSHEHSVGPA